MDAPALTPDQTRELAALRRRAYGPGADIATDPTALARLGELEGAHRAPSAIRAAAPPAGRRRAGAEAAPARAVPGEPVAPSPPSDEPSQPSPPPAVTASASPRRPWLRRVPPLGWVIAVSALCVVAGVGGAVGQLTSPRSDVQLTRVTAGEPLPSRLSQQGFLGYYDMPLESFEQYRSFRSLDVWSAQRAGGTRCLIVFAEGFRSEASMSCTPAGLDPVVDFTVWPGVSDEIAGGLPEGSVLRFQLHDDRVHVWARAAGASDLS